MLVLASASTARQALLRSAGVRFSVQPVQVDEDAIRQSLEIEGATPRDVADTLAEYKARRGAARAPEHPVLGSDQILDLGGRIFTKPKDRDAAAQTLSELQGKTHKLLSAAVIYFEGEPVWRHVGQARLTMHSLSPEQIEAYLSRAWPDVSGSVGAYHAEGLGAQLFARIDGDWHSVLGLPLLNVLSFLRTRGWLEP